MAPIPADEKFSVGWICALQLELDAAKRLLDEEYGSRFGESNDNNLYILGRIGHLNVVLVCLPMGLIGTNMAGLVAARMMTKFQNIKIGLLVGIGGGLPDNRNDIRLGDVVVSRPSGRYGGVVQYDMGKWNATGFESLGSLWAIPERLLALLNLMPGHSAQLENFSSKLYPGENLDKLHDADGHQLVERPPGNRENGPHVFYGTVASGNAVIKDARVRDVLTKEHGVLCFEMEAAGLMNHPFPCLVVRGIADYADLHKDDRWHKYAALTAATYAKDFLCKVPQDAVRTIDPIRKESDPPIPALIKAATYAVESNIRKELENKVDVNIKHDGATALHKVAFYGHASLVPIFSEYKADFEARNSSGWSPLHLATYYGHLATVKALLEHGAQIEARVTSQGCTPLYQAAEKGRLAVLQFLVEKGADISTRSDTGWTPVHIAAYNGHEDTIRGLIDLKFDTDTENNFHATPLYKAAEKGHSGIVRLLAENQGNVNFVASDGWRPLHTAAERGHASAIKQLLEWGADLDARNDEGCTPLYVAAKNGHRDATEVLLWNGADVNTEMNTRWTPLQAAAKYGHSEVVRSLLSFDAAVDKKNAEEATALFLGANNATVTALLLDANADVSARQIKDWQPLHQAAYLGKLAVAQALLAHGAAVDAENDTGVTPFWKAAEKGHTAMMSLLISHGANVAKKSNTDWSALHVAAEAGHVPAVKLLLSRGVSTTGTNRSGKTPLQVATAAKQHAVVELLSRPYVGDDDDNPEPAAVEKAPPKPVQLQRRRRPNQPPPYKN